MTRHPLLQFPAALLAVALVGLWTISPACDCQWRVLFGGSVDDTAAAGVVMLDGEGQAPEHCTCDEHHVKAAESAPTHLKTGAPSAACVLLPAVAPIPPTALARGHGSGCDPPPPAPLRTHLLLRRLLI